MNTNIYGIDTLSQLLNATSLRHRAIAQNVANVNTPNYKRREVTFEEDLAKALSSGSPTAAASVKPKIVEVDEPDRVDGNSVDIDREMNDLMRNGLLYQAAIQILTSRINSLKTAIVGR